MSCKMKKCCPNCCQLYQLKALTPKGYGNIPLFLSCGHSMCENCISNIVKFAEPIECKICHKDMVLTSEDHALLMKKNCLLHELFPINVYMLGELAQEHIKQKLKIKDEDKPCYIDLESLIKNSETTQGKCIECNRATTKMCQQCKTFLCTSCFNKSHKNFVTFQNHVLKNIEAMLKPTRCNIHKDKPLDYYCKTCEKPICVDCFMIGGEKSCKSHNVVSIHEVNESLMEELSEVMPKVDELFRRLTKTAVDIGNILLNLQNETEASDSTKFMNNIEQHYSKLLSIIQTKKHSITSMMIKSKSFEKSSLIKAKESVEGSITKAKKFLNHIETLDTNKLIKANISAILQDAKEILQIPWYLKKDDKVEPWKVNINEVLYENIEDFVSIEDSSSTCYDLWSTSELEEKQIAIPPSPPSPVYPPELVQDVHQLNKPKEKYPPKGPYTKAPNYHAKSGSCSSIKLSNSGTSYSSYRSYDQYNAAIVQPVQPFQNQYPKLQEGSREVIYVTHVVDPQQLFVQLACLQPRVDELLRESRNALSAPAPSAHRVAEGKVYLVQNQANKSWLRCRVVSVDQRNANKPKYHVFCMDFGWTEIVTIDKLRLLAPARVHSPPPFAIRCAIANCQPKNGAWTSDDAILIQNIIDDKQAVIHVHRIQSTSADSETLEVDMVTFEHGVSVAHALQFHGRAYLPERLPCPKVPGIAEKPRIFVTNNDFKLNSTEEVLITHITSPDNFYVQMHHTEKVYEKLCQDLDREYNTTYNSKYIYLPEKGMFCVVYVSKHGAGVWERARVEKVGGEGRVRLTLLDTGSPLQVDWSALRRLAPRFARMRALATECHLAGVTPTNKQWNTDSVALLKQFEGRVLDLHVEDNRNINSLGVTLYDKADVDNVLCINELMIRHKFAVTFGVFMFNKSFEKENPTKNYNTGARENKPQPEQNITTILKRIANAEEKQIKNKSLKAKDKGPLKLEVKVLNYQSPSLLYVSVVQQQEEYNDMFEKIQNHYTKKTEKPKENWNVGDTCCTLCIQSKTWRRAVILEILNGQAKVFYSDYACVEIVPLNSLRELTKEFMSLRNRAIMCHLYGVMSTVGEEWPLITKEYLQDLIDAYPRIFFTKKGKLKGKSMPVELWVYHTIQGGALDPDVSEWQCLNKKIIEQGLGIPDKSEEVTLDNDNAESKPQSLSFLENTGSVKDADGSKAVIRKFDPDPRTKRPCDDVIVKSHSDPNYIVDAGEVEDKLASLKSLQIDDLATKDWNQLIMEDEESNSPTEELVSFARNTETKFLCNIAFVKDVNKLELSVVFDDEKNAVYDKMFSELQKDSAGMYALNGIFENKACIAIFPEDGLWYRAVILQYSEVKGLIKVKYVDYGNEDVISLADIREIHDKYLELPPATITAKLHDVEVNPDVDVKVVAQEYQDLFINNGPFRAIVVNYDENETPCVELRNDDNDLVYEVLFEKKMFHKSG